MVYTCEDGTRIGCPLGTFSYCIGAQELYEKLATKYTEFAFCAATDDLTPAIPPPGDGDWERTYARIREYLTDMKSFAHEIGLSIHPTKGGILLPNGAPQPVVREGERQLTIREGLVISGTPVGPSSFKAQFVSNQVSKLKRRSGCAR